MKTNGTRRIMRNFLRTFLRRQTLKIENRPASVLHWFRCDAPKALTLLRQATTMIVSWTFLFAPVYPVLMPSVAKAQPAPPPRPAATSAGCNLQSAKGQIQHVIYIQFDNVHFRRDNPNVPSDLEQMPHLLNFLETNGTFLTNHHTPLISHTADADELNAAEFHGHHISEHRERILVFEANLLADYVNWLANH
jgi:hypothetical protein